MAVQVTPGPRAQAAEVAQEAVLPAGTVIQVVGAGGTMENVVIGGVKPAAGAFTTLSATTPLPISSGGTGAVTAAAALAALGGATKANSMLNALIFG